MASSDLIGDLKKRLPKLKGRLLSDVLMSEVTWFRVGGPAQLFFTPADEEDLANFLKEIGSNMPVFVMGLGSNLLVRDGGVLGVVLRLGGGFNQINLQDNFLKVGAGVPDVKLARAAAEAGLSGLSFFRGIPGCVGGALRMNAGAHGRETKDVVIEARALDREGNLHILSNSDLKFSYRHCDVPKDWIFTEATFKGERGDERIIKQEMEEIAKYREEKQPIRERTGGSTFKNPEGHSAWKLIDSAGCRGLRIGGAKVSEMHCNFLINDMKASGEDIETLGETVRARVKKHSGIVLQWEIIRLGIPRDGRPTGEALAMMEKL